MSGIPIISPLLGLNKRPEVPSPVGVIERDQGKIKEDRDKQRKRRRAAPRTQPTLLGDGAASNDPCASIV